MGRPMNLTEEKIVKQYLSKIGRKGGKKGKRYLDPSEAKNMVKIREAKKAYSNYFAECFWSFDPNLKITKHDVSWVAEQLMKNGSMECWKIGRRLCR